MVGYNDVLLQVLWTWYFMESQGYPVHPTKLYQDNMSTILLGKNGKASSSKCTWHIDTRYFFITDRVENKEIEMISCPTGDMVADLLRKPLQGSLFKKFRDNILNVQDGASVPPAVTMIHRSVLRKCMLLRKCTHNNCVPEPRTVLRVCWKWPVSDIRKRQGQPLTNCKYKSKLFIAAEKKHFARCTRTSHFNLKTGLHDNQTA